MGAGPQHGRSYRVQVRRFGPEEQARPGDFRRGDFILTHGASIFSWLIRVGQGLRFWGADRRYTWWNHAALIISDDGALVEALGAGVQQTDLTRYTATEYHLVRLGDLADDHDRDQVVAFGRWCLGEEYGWTTIVSITLSLLTGVKFSFGFDGQSICSGLVARALERTNVIFDRSPSHIMPADLAMRFRVEPPPSGTDKGEPQKPIPGRSGSKPRERVDIVSEQ
jgi:hypothetical protein